ncbi:MAG TPA: GAF domain-containing sensor histidine kinase [Sphingobium sp.]
MSEDVPQLLIDVANDCVRDANEAAARIWGISAAELGLRSLGDLFDPKSKATLQTWAASAQASPLAYPVGIVHSVSTANGGRPSRWMIEVNRVAGQNMLDCRLHADTAEDLGSEIRRLNWALDAYRRSAKALMRAQSMSEMAERVCAAIVEHDDYALAVITLADPAPSRQIHAVAVAGDAQDYFTGITLSWDPDELSGQGPTGHAMRSGSPYIMFDSHIDPVFAPWRARAESFGIRSSATVPFKVSAGQMGAVLVYASTPYAFTEREVEVFQELGDEFAFAMSVLADQARLETARRAQLAAEAAARERQADLARVSRVLVLGEFASSIAHELAQPLAAIATNSETALRWLSASPANPEGAKHALQRIVRDADRAHDVIKRTRALIAKEEPEFAPCPINLLIEEVIFMLSDELIRAGIHVEIDLDPSRPFVQANSVQVQQVLINLIINARDAMRSLTDRPGRLRLTSARSDGQWVTVQVIDNGEGIAPEAQSQLFEHLFSTKKEGLGLGLPISRSIVEMHGGRIDIGPGEENGTVVSFTLPLRREAAA